MQPILTFLSDLFHWQYIVNTHPGLRPETSLSLFPTAGKVTNLPAGRQEEPPLLIKG
jgi:hypothetical protein